MKKTLIFITAILLSTQLVKSQTAVLYKDDYRNKVLVVLTKDSVFSSLEESSTKKRKITYKGKVIRYNIVRYDYQKFYIKDLKIRKWYY